MIYPVDGSTSNYGISSYHH